MLYSDKNRLFCTIFKITYSRKVVILHASAIRSQSRGTKYLQKTEDTTHAHPSYANRSKKKKNKRRSIFTELSASFILASEKKRPGKTVENTRKHYCVILREERRSSMIKRSRRIHNGLWAIVSVNFIPRFGGGNTFRVFFSILSWIEHFEINRADACVKNRSIRISAFDWNRPIHKDLSIRLDTSTSKGAHKFTFFTNFELKNKRIPTLIPLSATSSRVIRNRSRRKHLSKAPLWLEWLMCVFFFFSSSSFHVKTRVTSFRVSFFAGLVDSDNRYSLVEQSTGFVSVHSAFVSDACKCSIRNWREKYQ